MKHKSHSGLKKRMKVKKSKGEVKFYFQKAARKHLMINKSKSQKGLPKDREVSSAMKGVMKRLIAHM